MQEIADAYGEGKPKARESVWTAPAKAVAKSPEAWLAEIASQEMPHAT